MRNLKFKRKILRSHSQLQQGQSHSVKVNCNWNYCWLSNCQSELVIIWEHFVFWARENNNKQLCKVQFNQNKVTKPRTRAGSYQIIGRSQNLFDLWKSVTKFIFSDKGIQLLIQTPNQLWTKQRSFVRRQGV